MGAFGIVSQGRIRLATVRFKPVEYDRKIRSQSNRLRGVSSRNALCIMGGRRERVRVRHGTRYSAVRAYQLPARLLPRCRQLAAVRASCAAPRSRPCATIPPPREATKPLGGGSVELNHTFPRPHYHYFRAAKPEGGLHPPAGTGDLAHARAPHQHAHMPNPASWCTAARLCPVHHEALLLLTHLYLPAHAEQMPFGKNKKLSAPPRR